MHGIRCAPGALLGALTLGFPLWARAAAAPAADASEATDVRTLREQVRALQAEVKDLRDGIAALRAPGFATTRPAGSAAAPDGGAQDAGALDAARSDAERRSRMLDAAGITAGWSDDHGFFLKSDDGSFLLSPFALFQARGVVNHVQHGQSDGRDNTQTDVEVRRLQLGLDGHLVTPDLTYRIFWQSSELTGGNLSLLMAWVQYRFHDTPWVIGGGQFKDPLDHEQLVSDAKQLAADRTYVDDTLAGGEAFSKGVTLRYDDRQGPFRAEGAVTSGFNVNNTGFQQFPTTAANYGVAARGEFKLLGDWRDYEQFTSEGDRRPGLLVLGAGADYTEAGHTAALRHVADVQYNVGPLGFYAAYLGRYTRGTTAGRGGDTYDASARAQAAWLFAPHWEAFARYDYLQFGGLEFKARTRSTVHEITLGGTYYFVGQSAKFTVDASYLPNGAPLTDAGNDIVASPGHAQVVARAQLQLML